MRTIHVVVAIISGSTEPRERQMGIHKSNKSDHRFEQILPIQRKCDQVQQISKILFHEPISKISVYSQSYIRYTGYH